MSLFIGFWILSHFEFFSHLNLVDIYVVDVRRYFKDPISIRLDMNYSSRSLLINFEMNPINYFLPIICTIFEE